MNCTIQLNDIFQNISLDLFSVHNIMSLSCHEHKCSSVSADIFGKLFLTASISQNVVSLNTYAPIKKTHPP